MRAIFFFGFYGFDNLHLEKWPLGHYRALSQTQTSPNIKSLPLELGVKPLTLIFSWNYWEEGLFSDVIAITLQRYPTQNNFTFMYTKSAELY